MCFSTTGSFIAGAGLLTAGGYATRLALAHRRSYVPLALMPFGFGIQQLVEGVVWMKVLGQDPASASTPALGFMLFSHFIWLFWVALAVGFAEVERTRRRVFFAIALFGFVFGAGMYLPFPLMGWHSVKVISHSIHYGARLIYDQYVPREVVNTIYALLAIGPLLGSSERRVKIFGGVMLVSVSVSLAFFHYAFTSVWCFFAAVLSLYLVQLVRQTVSPSAPALTGTVPHPSAES